MTSQQKEIYDHVKHMAEEQVFFLKNRYKMQPNDIIQMYGESASAEATYSDAVEHIAHFNLQNAAKNGFIAS